jgi:hypothetical protein
MSVPETVLGVPSMPPGLHRLSTGILGRQGHREWESS